MRGSKTRTRPAMLAVVAGALCGGLCIGGCGANDERPGREPAHEAPSEFTALELRNGAYPSQHVLEGRVRLHAGVFEDPDRRLVVRMLPEYAVGDLNGDGIPDAAVLLSTSTGGSGVFQDLAVVLNGPFGTARQVTVTFLGDREPVDRIRIENGEISLELLEHGAGDPMCCPSQSVTRRYRLRNGEIVPAPAPGERPTESS